jgi:hypothetical protein
MNIVCVPGYCKGYGFVDFATVDEAIKWMEATKGELILKDSEVRLDYSHHESEEWNCILVNNRGLPMKLFLPILAL